MCVVEILAHIDDKPFKVFIADRVIATQMDLLRLLNIGGVNKDNGGVNIESTINNGGVNSLESELLDVIQSMPGLNAPTIATTINKNLRTIQRYLKKLADEGKVEFRFLFLLSFYRPLSNSSEKIPSTTSFSKVC